MGYPGKRLLSVVLLSYFFALHCSIAAANGTQGPLHNVNLRLESATFSVLIEELEKSSRMKILYVSGLVNEDQLFDVDYKNESLGKVLEEILTPLNLTYEFDSEFVIIKKATEEKVKAQEKKNNFEKSDIRGKVIDEKSEPLLGVSVYIKGTSSGTITDISGDFFIDGLSEKDTLVFSMVGFVSRQILYRDISSQGNVTVILKEDVEMLGTVVVVGYGTTKKADLIGAISTIDVVELKTTPVSNFDAALQGMSSGVSVLSQSGKPGAPTAIRIRGANSINLPTDPLWVVDGLPIFSTPVEGGSSLNPIATLNPGDIESLSVLKDAAATAIYGSRASNGVILVNTKKGIKGESTLNLSYNTGVTDFTRTMDDVGYVNADEWFEVMDIANANSGLGPFNLNDYYRDSPNSQSIDRIDRSIVRVRDIDTDWFDEAFSRGSFQQLNVSSSRGFDKGSFYFSFNYRNDKGVLANNELERISFRANVTSQIAQNLTLDTRLFFSYVDLEDRGDNLTTITKFSLPWMPVRNPNNPELYFLPYTGANIIAQNDPNERLNNTKTYRGLLNFSLKYDFPEIKGLSLQSTGAVDFLQSNRTTFASRNINLNNAGDPSSIASEGSVTPLSINYNTYATYVKDYDKHSLTFTLGGEGFRTSTYTRNVSAQGVPGTIQELGKGGLVTGFQGELINERYLGSFFGRINYNYGNKYLLGFSGRRDGSSVLPRKNRWQNFYAVALGWVLSEEAFLNTLPSSVFLKLRGSYGQVGNQGIPANQDAPLYFQEAAYGSRQISGSGTLRANIVNQNITWEVTNSLDVALDFGLMHDRINGSIGYYYRNVDNLFLDVRLPSSAGIAPVEVNDAQVIRFLNDNENIGPNTNNVLTNIGELTNDGFEFDLNTVNIDNGRLRWTTNFNISFVDNKVKSLSPELNTGIGLTNEYSVNTVGNRRFVWYLADYAGVDSDTGIPYIYARDQEEFLETGRTVRLQTEAGADSLILANVENIPLNLFVQGDKSSDPTYYGGITNKFEYLGFDFSFMLAFSGGNYILDYDRQIAVYANSTRTLLKEALTDSWKQPGDDAKYPKLVVDGIQTLNGESLGTFNDENVYHNRELYKADFIRLRNITLGYTLKPALAKRLRMKSLRVYAGANNLFTWTDYPGFDPEGTPTAGSQIIRNNTQIPQLKTYMAGIDIQF